MSVSTQIDRLENAKAAIKTAIEGKGVTVPSATKLDEMAPLIESITPTLQSKSVTITSNGTASVTPDSGYDGLSSVNVTVDVSGSTTPSKCTISLTHSGSSTPIAYLYQYVLGSVVVVGFGNLAKNASVTLSNVVCGSLLAIVTKFEEALDYSSNITGEEYITYNNSAISLTGVITPKEADATGTITVIMVN